MTPFTELVDLAAERLGGAAVLANDDFFAPKENLVRAAPAEWREGVYTDRGKWMDGWETRRRRTPGYDWCIIRLGLAGIVRGIVVDTAFFRGNYPEHCSLDGCNAKKGTAPEQLAGDASIWYELVPKTPLRGDTRNEIEAHGERQVTHVRLNIFPDGGVARLRVHGEVTPDWDELLRDGGDIDLAAMANGGWVVGCSDMFFGHRHNLILPGDSTHMGDGWETRRRRGPGNDWTIVRLGRPGSIHRVEIDTHHFKGNAPGACAMAWCHAPRATPEQLSSVQWNELLPRTDLEPHARHSYTKELRPVDRATHVRLDIFPDGGIARLRVWGTPEAAA